MTLRGDMRSMEYPFEEIIVELRGVRWAVWGTAILEEDPPFEDYGLDQVDPTGIVLTSLNRLEGPGIEEYEDFPLSLIDHPERIAFNEAVAKVLNSPEWETKLHNTFYEKVIEQ